MPHHLRLDELLARDVRVHWSEGVAVVQSVCRRLAESGLPGFPPASAISLGADGTVSVVDTSRLHPAAAAAHVLATMLGDDVPVRLRLIVTQAAEEHGPNATVRDLSEALGYFERPGHEQIIRDLFERAMAATKRPERAPAAAEPTNPQPETGTRETGVPPRKLTSRTAVLGAGAAVLCTLVWFLASASGAGTSAALETWKQTFVAPGPAAKDEPVEGASLSAVPVRRRDADAGRSEIASDASAETSRPGSVPRAEPLAQPSRRTGLLPERILFPVATAADGPQIRPVVYDPVTILEAATPGAPLDAPDRDRLYTTADSGVTPPRHVYPKLPLETRPITAAETRTVLEIVVSGSGLVEHVKLRTPPRDVHEFMLVSAVKAWRFEPATVGGHPVRFLHRIAITRE